MSRHATGAIARPVRPSRSGRISLVLGLLLALLPARLATASVGECDQIVLYDCCEDSTGVSTDGGWHLFDPLRNRDRRLLGSGCGGLRWDTAFTFVEFEVRDTLWRMDWREGAMPHPLVALPHDPNRCTVWWNPDSAVWQMLVMTAARSGESLDNARFDDSIRAEVWQRSEHGGKWRLNRSQIVDADERGPARCDEWVDWLSPCPAHEPRVTLPDLEAENGAFAGEPVPPPPDEEPDPRGYRSWSFVPARMGSDRGFVYESYVGAPYSDGAMVPIYHWNRRTGAFRLVRGTPRETEMSAAIIVRCDRALLRWFDIQLLDARTGEVLRTLPTRTAIWIRRPAP